MAAARITAHQRLDPTSSDVPVLRCFTDAVLTMSLVPPVPGKKAVRTALNLSSAVVLMEFMELAGRTSKDVHVTQRNSVAVQTEERLHRAPTMKVALKFLVMKHNLDVVLIKRLLRVTTMKAATSTRKPRGDSKLAEGDLRRRSPIILHQQNLPIMSHVVSEKPVSSLTTAANVLTGLFFGFIIRRRAVALGSIMEAVVEMITVSRMNNHVNLFVKKEASAVVSLSFHLLKMTMRYILYSLTPLHGILVNFHKIKVPANNPRNATGMSTSIMFFV